MPFLPKKNWVINVLPLVSQLITNSAHVHAPILATKFRISVTDSGTYAHLATVFWPLDKQDFPHKTAFIFTFSLL